MWYNSIMLKLLNSPMHGMISGNTMIINFVGRKSGRTYRIPVGYRREGVTFTTISNRQRTWWRNLRGGASVTLRLQGKDVIGWANVVEDEQAVIDGLREFIGGDARIARMIGVKLDEGGMPEHESLNKAAEERVVILTTLK
jgi:hypothetical protein